MKNALSGLSLLLAMTGATATSATKVNDEHTLQLAIAEANADSCIEKIIFMKKANISLTAPIIYTGKQALTLVGNDATIDGSSAGTFTLDENLTAITKDGSLIFNTASNINIRRLSVINSATRGIVINIPDNAQGDDIAINLFKVNIKNSALYGLHIDDNTDEFDDGHQGSEIGINLHISKSSFTENGTGAIDFDGIRVDERAQGDINAVIVYSHIDNNGGDGIELDEAGNGSVDATMIHVSINNNGFFNEDDLDDGFDIDEADDGDILISLFKVQVNNNMDEGLDFDEEGSGNIELKLRRVTVLDNADEGIKVDEEDAGVITAKLFNVKVIDSGDDGIQFTELGEGDIEAILKKVTANKNAKYGIKMQQWFIEDEAGHVEEPGLIKAKQISLKDNIKGDEIETNNMIIQ